MTDKHDAAPTAAEIAAITHILNGWDKLLLQAEMGSVDTETVMDGAVLALNTIQEPVRRLLGALEAENAALREQQMIIMRGGDGLPYTSALDYFNRPSEGE